MLKQRLDNRPKGDGQDEWATLFIQWRAGMPLHRGRHDVAGADKGRRSGKLGKGYWGTEDPANACKYMPLVAEGN